MKMNCKSCKSLIQDHIDRRLDSGSTNRVEAHLAVCSDCAKLRKEFVAVATLIAKTPSDIGKFDVVRRSLVLAKTEVAKRTVDHAMAVKRNSRLAACATLLLIVVSVSMLNRNSRIIALDSNEISLAPYDLVSLHATARSSLPLADTGKITFALTESTAMDYADNALPEPE